MVDLAMPSLQCIFFSSLLAAILIRRCYLHSFHSNSCYTSQCSYRVTDYPDILFFIVLSPPLLSPPFQSSLLSRLFTPLPLLSPRPSSPLLLHFSLLFSLLFSSLLFSSHFFTSMHFSTVLYSTLLYSTLLYSTLLYSTLLYSTLLFC